MKKKSVFALIACGVVLLGLVLAKFLYVQHHQPPSEEIDNLIDSPMPTYDIHGVELPPLDEPTVVDKEGIAPAPVSQDERYLNNQVLSCAFGPNDSATMYIGVDLGEQAYQDAIYLNLSCSEQEAGADVGYYVSVTGESDVLVQFGKWLHSPNANGHGYIIQNTYDQLKPCQYVDAESFGVSWEDERIGRTPSDYGGTELYIRAIRLADQKLIGVCKAVIEYDPQNDIYALASLSCADVHESTLISTADRQALIEWAYDHVSQGRAVADVSGTLADIENADKHTILNGSTVEFTANRTYFPYVYGLTRLKNKSGSICKQYDNLYAVSLDCGNANFITLYFSPCEAAIEDYQWAYSHKDEASGEWVVNDDAPPLVKLSTQTLALVGSDVYAPRSLDVQSVQSFFENK